MATLKEIFNIEKNKKNIIITSSILAGTLALGIVAGVQFKQFSNYQTYFHVRENVKVEKFSDYSPNLKNTVGDADIYKIEGKEAGPSVLIIGGTHPNEPAGQIAATVLLENIEVERGTVYIITEANKSAYTHSHPLEATTFYYNIKTTSGKFRKFKFGSRATNTNQQWPNPDVYTTQSGQKLSSTDTRNLNRAYPGKINGTYSEQVAYAITQCIIQNDIAVTIDLHEASPEYNNINSIVGHTDASEIGAFAAAYVSSTIKDTCSYNNAPEALRGLSHIELGEATDTLAFLCETSNASQGKFRGAFTEDLIITGKDKFYEHAMEIDKKQGSKLVYGAPVHLNERVARQLLTVDSILYWYNQEFTFGEDNFFNTFLDGRRLAEGEFVYSNIPSFKDAKKDIGQFLAEPK